MVFGFIRNVKKKEPEAEEFLTAAGPTKKAAAEFKEAKAQYTKNTAAAKKPAAPKQGFFVKQTTKNVLVTSQAEKDIFDPSRSYPTYIPYWAKQKKRLF